MTDAVVIYRSKYGSARKYAEWIAESLNASLFECSTVNASDFTSFNTIVYGGGLYAGGLNGISFIKRNFKYLQDKNLILFTCGIADPQNQTNKEHIQQNISRALSPSMMKKIKVFSLRGGIDYQRLSFVHRVMMGALRRALLRKKPEDLTEEDRQLLDTYGGAIDFVNKASIDPILEYVHSLR